MDKEYAYYVKESGLLPSYMEIMLLVLLSTVVVMARYLYCIIESLLEHSDTMQMSKWTG